MAWMYNPKTNRWENPASVSGKDNPPPEFIPITGATYVDTVTGETKQYVGLGSPDRVVSAPSTTTTPKTPATQRTPATSPASTTTVPKSPTTTVKPTTTTTAVKPTTTTVPSTAAPTTTTTTVPKSTAGTKKTTGRFEGGVRPKRGQFPGAIENQPINITEAINNALSDPNTALYNLLLSGGSGGGGSSGPSEAQLRQQRISAAQKMGRQTSAMAKDYYGKQSNAANQAIDAATAELLANLGQPKAYSNVPLVTVPPALQGLQQNLLAYGATGQDAAAEAAQGQQTNDMYAALAKRSAEQLGAADQGYFDALRRAALGAQAAGRQGVAQNTADLQNQVLLANIQALLNASQ